MTESNAEGGSSRFAPYSWMILGCFAFSWMGACAHGLGKIDCDWRIVALARSLLAFLFAISLARACGAKLVFWKPRILWLRSIAGSLSLLCTFFALSWLRPSEVLTLTNTFPIWVAILSWPLLRVRPGISVWLAAACGVLGVVVMQQPWRDFASTPSARIAVALALVAAMTSAVAMLGLHRLRELDPWAIVVHFSGIATLFVLGAWFVGEPPDLDQVLASRPMWLLVGVGVTATLGQLCLTRAFTIGQPARVSIVGLVQIVFAMGLDLMLFDFEFDATTLAGIGLVVGPSAWVMAGKTDE